MNGTKVKLSLRLPFLQSKATLLNKQAAQEEKMLALTAYELDMIPKLWWNIRNHYPYFCETVCHSWMMKCPTMVMQLSKHELTPIEYETVRRESQELEHLLNEVIDSIAKRRNFYDAMEFLVLYRRKRIGSKGRRTRWRFSAKTRVFGTFSTLGEALMQQFKGHLNIDDVHERELEILIWNHFVRALTHCLNK